MRVRGAVAGQPDNALRVGVLGGLIDFFRNKPYNGGMITYQHLSERPRQFLALTGLTVVEFKDLLPAFEQAYLELYSVGLTLQGQPRRRVVGAGRHSRLDGSADKLLFLLVYLKTYPLQAVLAELFDLSTTRANYWLQHLLPVLQRALDHLGVLPERDSQDGACQARRARESRKLIIDATERRRQRPKNPEKQALHYSGKKKTHTDKNVLVVKASSRRVLYLGATHAGPVHEKKIVDQEPIAFPPDVTLYKDAGFQGYEPPVARSCQAKKKDEATSAHGAGKGYQSEIGTNPRSCRTCYSRREKKSDREGHLPQHQREHV